MLLGAREREEKPYEIAKGKLISGKYPRTKIGNIPTPAIPRPVFSRVSLLAFESEW